MRSRLFLPSLLRSLDLGLRSRLFLPSLLRSLDLRLLGGVSSFQFSSRLRFPPGSGDPALLRRGAGLLLLSSWSGVLPPLASAPSGVKDRRLLLLLSNGLYLLLESGLYLLLLL